MRVPLLLCALSLATQAADVTKIATFDGAKETMWHWRDLNDPVMGGQSKATWVLANQTGIFDGYTAIVPSLKAPGFCNAETTNGLGVFARGVDLAGTSHVVLKVRHTGAAYAGYKFSFAADTINPQFKSFKAGFQIQHPGEWEEVSIPWSDFSNDWSSYTGRCDTIDPTGTAHKCCNSTYPEVCPTEKNKKDISQLGFWTEGVEGKFHLEIQWVGAAKMARASANPGWNSTCSGSIQSSLKYNISGRSADSTLPFGGAPGESVADAVCCDPLYKPYAEPQGFYAWPSIDLFGNLAQGQTTFYDSVCGIPLFTAPRNRTLAEFEADTKEHGWPSFRAEEVVQGNVLIDQATGIVTSKCGTHLGSFLPDAQGPRYCMDLSCISGQPKKA